MEKARKDLKSIWIKRLMKIVLIFLVILAIFRVRFVIPNFETIFPYVPELKIVYLIGFGVIVLILVLVMLYVLLKRPKWFEPPLKLPY